MKAGTRIVYPDEVSRWDADIFQISVYRGISDHMRVMEESCARCRDEGKSYVIHPVGFSVLREDHLDSISRMAELADLALILHDERTSEGDRLDPQGIDSFHSALNALSEVTDISIENAAATGDIDWFWNEFAHSVTLDIGHVESSGLDSVDFVQALDDRVIEKLRYVHIHRNNGLHGGITDHWPLTPDCREVSALRALLQRKSDISVILELNEVDSIGDNLSLLRSLIP
jgi:hypothetical protein